MIEVTVAVYTGRWEPHTATFRFNDGDVYDEWLRQTRHDLSRGLPLAIYTSDGLVIIPARQIHDIRITPAEEETR